MHLLEAGVNLIYIRDFLGHVSVTTTEVYAKTNPELKRKFLEENSVSLDVGGRYSKQDKIEEGNLAMTIPEKPQSSSQRYISK